jgi:hypothetical protein
MTIERECRGECILHCECTCYGEVCTCGHREHKGWCPSPSGCCKLVKCRAYSVCRGESPQRLLDFHQGLCGASCAIRLGPFRNTNEVGECPICFEQETFEELTCGHKLCFNCWNNIAHYESHKCPMCRRTNQY